MTIVECSTLSVIFTFIFICLFRRWALRLGLVDHPGGRKRHDGNVPLIGGIAIYLGFTLAILSFPFTEHYFALIAGSGLLIFVGMLDDHTELNSKVRLLAQIGGAMIMISWGKVQISNLGDLLFLGNIDLGVWALPLTLFLVVGFINAMNMTDGQDGLAGGIALGEVVLLGYLCWHNQRTEDLTLLTIFGLLLIIFLFFNMRWPWRKHAAIFLGDAGSTFIAFTIAWFAISSGQSAGTIKPVIVLWILAFPVFDLVQVCLARFELGKPLSQPSLDHLHHLLQSSGVDPGTSTWTLIILSFSLGMVGILLNYFQIPDGWQLITWLITLLIYLKATRLIRKSAQYYYATG